MSVKPMLMYVFARKSLAMCLLACELLVCMAISCAYFKIGDALMRMFGHADTHRDDSRLVEALMRGAEHLMHWGNGVEDRMRARGEKR